MSYIGTTKIGKMYLGTTEIAKAYLGNQLVYSSGQQLSYVSDGLVFRIDGKTSSGGTVSDMISGNTFDAVSPNNITFSDGAIILDNGQLVLTSFSLGSNEDYTVEACFAPSTLTSDHVLFTSGTNSTSTWMPQIFISSANGYITYAVRKGVSYLCNLSTNTNYTVSMNGTRGILNGLSMTSSSTHFYANTARTVIGARYYSSSYQYPFYGKIYSIRVYSRRLSENEMLYNQNVDNMRFNLGLTLPSVTLE